MVIVAGVVPVEGLTESQLPPLALAVQDSADPVEETEMACETDPVPTVALRLTESVDAISDAAGPVTVRVNLISMSWLPELMVTAPEWLPTLKWPASAV